MAYVNRMAVHICDMLQCGSWCSDLQDFPVQVPSGCGYSSFGLDQRLKSISCALLARPSAMVLSQMMSIVFCDHPMSLSDNISSWTDRLLWISAPSTASAADAANSLRMDALMRIAPFKVGGLWSCW